MKFLSPIWNTTPTSSHGRCLPSRPAQLCARAQFEFGQHGIWLRDVGITNNNWGRPLVILSERGQRICERLGIGKAHVSLTDDAGLVIAFAVVETAATPC